MIRFTITACMAAAMLFLLTPRPVVAQAVANAQIHGIVRDPSGAVVANARIKATQTETGRIQSTTSVSDGSYVLPDLAVGSYKLEVSASGFRAYVQTGIVLQVGNNVQVNISLQVGSVTQEVRVSADAAMVESQDTSISEVVDHKRIVNLPLNGRQATDLILLSGGAAMPPNSTRVITTHDFHSAVGISVSGGQINGNNYLLDGADHNDSHSNVNMPFPFPDALQEFSVKTNGISARYGLHPGSVVNVVTKSGTNSFHGSLFEFVRNGDFNARNYFAKTQDSLHRNQFGGTIGGPIKKDKIFIFSGFQATRERTAPSSSIAFVPTAAALQGDFSTLESAACQSSGVAKTLINPANGQPYTGNQIDPTTFSPAALALLQHVPVSTDPCGKLTYAIPNPNDENQYVGRVDWVQSSKNSVLGRYFIDDYANPGVYKDNLLTTTRSGLDQRAQSVVLGDQFSITPTIINAVHIDFSRLVVNRAQPQGMPSPAGLGVNMYNAIPDFTDLSVSNYFSVGGGSNAPATFTRNQWQFADDLDWIRGRHHLSLGAEAIAGQMDEYNIQYANGEFAFNGSQSHDALADFMLGRPSSLIDSNIARIDLRQKYVGLYFQDDVQVTSRLNVHVGVRWEPSLPEYDADGRGSHFSMSDFIAGNHTSVYTNAPAGLLFHGDPGIPKAYANGSYLDFAPRVGFAWDPTGSGKQTIRASYGIFYDQPESFTNRDFSITAPWGDAVTFTAPAGGFDDPFAGFPGGNPFPVPTPPAKDAPFPQSATYINLPLNLHHPYMQQWSLSLQRQFGADWLVSVDYVGNKATHFRSSTEQNPAIYIPGNSTVKNTDQRRLLTQLDPTQGVYYSGIALMDDGINTNYNALRLSAQHRFSHNFTLLSVYTYSHCLQDAETLGNRVSGNSESNPYNRYADYGACDYDLRHNLTNSLVYASPKFQNRAVDLFAGSWQLGLLVSAHTGFPFNPLTGIDASLSGVGLDRPDIVPGQDPYVRNMHTLLWINPAAFTQNAPGTFGTAGANSLWAPGYVDADANLARLFKIRERQQFELRFEFFNLFNHTNFQAPVSRFSSSSFGKIQSANPARILQFALKYSF